MPNKKITDSELETLRQSAEKMLARYSPAVDPEWWGNLQAAVVELQERRNHDNVPSHQNSTRKDR